MAATQAASAMLDDGEEYVENLRKLSVKTFKLLSN